MRPRFLQGDDRLVVEVIVVVVGEHDGVERRQVAESEQRGKPALGSGETGRPDPLAPHGVGEEAMPVDLEQNGRVAQPGHAQPRGRRRREAVGLDRNGTRRRPGLHVGVGPEEGHDGGPRVVDDRLRILEVRALPLGRLLHPLEPGTGRPATEGGTVRKPACGRQPDQPSGDQPTASPSPPSGPPAHRHHVAICRAPTGSLLAGHTSERRLGLPTSLPSFSGVLVHSFLHHDPFQGGTHA